MHFTISLGGGVQVSPAAYLSALKLAIANPDASFDASFRDPRGSWGGYSGSSIVREHWEMIRDRWASWNIVGKGNRANRRAAAIADRRAECKWCGQLTGSTSRKFCCASCARDYHS